MVALVEFFIVGMIFLLMVLLSKPEMEAKDHNLLVLVKRIVGRYWMYFIYPVAIILLALSISYNIQDWQDEMKAIFVSSIMLFIGFFLMTAMFLRLREKI